MTLRGHVSSRAGKPLGGVVVVARRRLKTGSAAFWGGATLSDARGDFALEDAEEGDYEIGGEESGLLVAAGAFVPYRLRRGSPPAQMTMPAPIQLSLQVLAPDGQVVRGQQLSLMSRTKKYDGVTRSRYLSVPAPKRSLELTVSEEATLFVSCFPLGWGFVDLREVAEGSASVQSVQLKRGGSLRLQAVDDGSGQPVAGAVSNIRVPDRSDFEKANVDTQGVEIDGQVGDIANLFHGEASDRGMATGEDGALAIPNLRPGFYAVNLTRAGFDEPGLQLVRIEEGRETSCTVRLKRSKPAPTTVPPK